MHVYCHYFEHTTITHICNHLKQLIKFNRPFPRSMRSQGKRPGRGSRQTGAVFEA